MKTLTHYGRRYDVDRIDATHVTVWASGRVCNWLMPISISSLSPRQRTLVARAWERQQQAAALEATRTRLAKSDAVSELEQAEDQGTAP